MNFKKFVSFSAAVAIASTLFAGLAITANAEGEPAYDDWTLTETYADTFGTGDISALLADGTWTSPDSRNISYRSGTEILVLPYNRAVTLNKTELGKSFYYTYKVQTYDASHGKVSLAGVNVDLVTATDISDKSTHTYTTVIDPINNMAYTYNYDKTLKSAVEFEGTVTGITFASTNNTSGNNFWVYDVVYGTAVNVNANPIKEVVVKAELEDESNYDEDETVLSSVWTATITNDTEYTLNTVEAKATQSNGQNRSDSATITEIAPGSSIFVVVVTNRNSGRLPDGVTVTLK